MSSPMFIPTPRYSARSSASTSDSSYSNHSSTPSPSSSWTPSGVYIPVHKRRAAAANSSISSMSSVRSTENSPPGSTSRIYSRTALLSLARTSLASHPSPNLTALLSTCPEIIDQRATGVARALAMGKTPIWHGNSGRSRGRRPRGTKNTGSGKRGKRDESLSSVGSERSGGSWRSA